MVCTHVYAMYINSVFENHRNSELSFNYISYKNFVPACGVSVCMVRSVHHSSRIILNVYLYMYDI